MAVRQSASMVGRDPELALLREAAVAASARRPSVVVVLGEAGIGKTRLVDELATLLEPEPGLVVRGACAPGAASGLPLGAVREVLRAVRRELGPSFGRLSAADEPIVSALLGEVADADRVVVSSQAALLDAVVRLLRDVARPRRLVMVVEDVHWADRTSMDLLEFLGRSLRDEQLLLVLTARSDDPAYEECRALVAELGGLRHGTRLQLHRLDESEVGEQVAALRSDADPAAVARIAAVSEGVPLFVEEVVDTDLDDVGTLAHLLLGHRLGRLSEAARSVVETAAVAVLEPSPRQLAAATPLPPDELDQAFAEAVAGGVLVRRHDRVGFRHALLREATLVRLPPRTAADLHGRWSAVIGDHPQGQAATVAAAHHRREAGDSAGALTAYVAAADLAHRISAYAEEAEMLEAAAEVWPDVPDAAERTGTSRSDLYGGAAWATFLAMADVERSGRLAEAAVAALPPDASPHRRAMARLLWHRTRFHGDDHLTTAEVLATVADVELDPSTDDAVYACMEAAEALVQAGELEGAEPYARRAMALAEAVGDLALTARATGKVADVLSRLGQDEQALAFGRRSVALAERSGDRAARVDTLTWFTLLEWHAGEVLTPTSFRVVELLGGDRPGPMPGKWGIATFNLAEGLTDAGRWEEAQAALDVVLAEEMPLWVYWCARARADQISVWRGDGFPPRDPDMADQDRMSENADTDDLVAAAYQMSDIGARVGEHACARSRMEPVLAEADDRLLGNPTYLLLLLWVAARIEAEIATGDTDATVEGGDRVSARVEHLLGLLAPGNPRDRAFAAHAYADLDRRRGTDSPDAWAAVVAAWREVPMPFQLATALVRLGESSCATGDRAGASAALREAAAIAERLGARPLVEEARGVARRAHLRVPGSDPDAAGELGLTRRELDVLRLIAEGASNGAIAQALVISPKTVSVHVSNILAKLGVANRGEAAAVAHRTGVV